MSTLPDPARRKPLSRRLRYEILRRDNHTCRYCGASAPDAKLTVDHVNPVALGGTDEPTNLVTACVACNGGKSSTSPDAPLVADVAEDALRWKQAKEAALELWRCEQARIQGATDEFEAHWTGWKAGDSPVPLDDGWDVSVAHWIERGFTEWDLIDMIPLAMKKKGVALHERWRYFCGVVWRTLDDIEAKAQRKVSEPEVPDGDDEDYDSYDAGFDDGAAHARQHLSVELERMETQMDLLRRRLAQVVRSEIGITPISEALDGFLDELEGMDD